MQERTIGFTTKDGFKLAGTLCIPDGAVQGVALIVAGSGPTDRDGNSSIRFPGKDIFNHINLYRDLAAHFAAQGIATLRYDKRACAGYAQQHAQHAHDPDLFCFNNLVNDADEAAAALMAQPEASGHRLAIAGHSEGGLIALMIAQRRATATLYLLATCGRTFRDVLRQQFYDRYFEQTGDAAGAAAFTAKGDEVMDAVTSGRPLPAPLHPGLSMVFNDATHPHFRQILDIDPVAIARTLSCHVLIVNGTSDIQVNHKTDAETLFAAFAQRALPAARQDIAKIGGASHCFKTPAHPLDAEGSFTGPTAPGLFVAIDSFIHKSKPGSP